MQLNIFSQAFIRFLENGVVTTLPILAGSRKSRLSFDLTSSLCRTLFVTCHAQPDFGDPVIVTLYKSSSPARWFGGNQLSSNYFGTGLTTASG